MALHPDSNRQPPNLLTAQQPGLGGLVEPRGAPPTSVREREGNVTRWLDFLVRPDVTAAMAQFGIQLLQPRPPGQTVGGQVGRALGGGLEAAGRAQVGQRDLDRQELERRLEEAKLGLEERRVRVGEAGVGTDRARTAIAGRQASTAAAVARTGDRRLDTQIKQNEAAVKAAAADLKNKGKRAEAKLMVDLFEAQTDIWEQKVRDDGVATAGPPPKFEDIQGQIQGILGAGTAPAAQPSGGILDEELLRINPNELPALADGYERLGDLETARRLRALIAKDQEAGTAPIEKIAPASAEPQIEPTPELAQRPAPRRDVQALMRSLPEKEALDEITRQRIVNDPKMREAAERKYGEEFVADFISPPIEVPTEEELRQQQLEARRSRARLRGTQ